MALYCYFKSSSNFAEAPIDFSLLNPNSKLSESRELAVINDANKAVVSVVLSTGRQSGSLSMEERKTRGTFERISPQEQAMVVKYACQHSNNAAVRHFSKEFGITVKPSCFNMETEIFG
uniref:Uncharacterized protein n=1 Tax=Amphimedon queenslandica TaxID=400682 RepID=A0A1X7TEK0_AMPQE